jgi:hypothetical protein
MVLQSIHSGAFFFIVVSTSCDRAYFLEYADLSALSKRRQVAALQKKRVYLINAVALQSIGAWPCKSPVRRGRSR